MSAMVCALSLRHHGGGQENQNQKNRTQDHQAPCPADSTVTARRFLA